MHLINRFFLKLALLPRRLYSRLGVDAVKLEAILTTKLILDDRRPHPVRQTAPNQKKPVTKATLGTMLMSGIMGLFFLFCFTLGSDRLTQLTFYFTFFFVLLSMTLITDFTSVLIDVRDNSILLPKPVSDKTVVVARLLHIFIHLCKIMVPMSLPGLLFIGVTNGLYAALLLLVILFFLTAFSIFFVNAVYMAILKFTTPQRFQSIITYVQIVFAIVIYGSYQFLPQMLNRLAGDGFYITRIPGIAFYPLYWFAASWKVALTFQGGMALWLPGVAGFLFPLVCMVAVVRFLAPAFNRKLSLLPVNGGQPQTTPLVKLNKHKSRRTWYSRLLIRGQVEQAAFDFTLKMMARSRDFKLKVYPGMGYLLVYGAFLLFRSGKKMWMHDSLDSKLLVLSLLYFLVFLLSMAIGQVVYSDKYKASWIFYTSPVETPGPLLTGKLKAVLVKFFLPFMLGISILALVFGGPATLPNLVLGFSNVVLICTVLVYVDQPRLPFAGLQNTNVKGSNFLKGLMVLFFSGAIATLHFFVYSMVPVIILLTGLSVLAVWLLFDSLRKTGWEKIVNEPL